MSDNREKTSTENTAGTTHLSPKMIYDELSTKIIGQDEAKKVVSNALFMHYIRYLQTMLDNKKDLKKSNVLLMGPTGCGKTYVVREGVKAIRKLTGYPICPLLEIDCTELTPRGWEGDDISGKIKDHYKRVGENEASFNTSVVFLDEFDKLCKPAIVRSGSDHNRNTQYNLLKVMEGCTLDVVRKTPYGNVLEREVDTSKMLFILAGNFSEVRENRVKKTIGYHALEEAPVSLKEKDMLTELEKAGVVTQIIGRTPFVAELQALSLEELKAIVKEQLIPEYADTWKFMGEKLEVSEETIDTIAQKCYTRKTGARGLQSDLNKHLEEELFKIEFKL